MRVRRRVSLLRRSLALFFLILAQCCMGKSVQASVLAQPARAPLAAAPSFIDSSEFATSVAFASGASRDFCAWMALSSLAILVRFCLGTLPNTLR